MKLRIYLATYFLFIVILFSSLGIVSAYMTNAQVNMYTEKCIREFHSIRNSLHRDLARLVNHGQNFAQEITILVDGYTLYFSQQGIIIDITDTHQPEVDTAYTGALVSYISRETGQYIRITGNLPDPLEHFHLFYYYNISAYIDDMNRIQNILLLVCIVFSVITAFALYFIVARLFKPLVIISNATRSIASGQYNERIHIKGGGELAQVADDFNQMAAQIQGQIHTLEKVAADKQQFIDNFAHEIRTPLTSIFGNAEYMQHALLDEGETVELTQLIMNNSTHMKQIANSLLQLATLRDYTPVMGEIPISRLFDDVSKTMYDSLYEKGVRLTTKINADTMWGQEDLIRSLLLNLCYNAVKACERGGIIELSARDDWHETTLSVRDNGHGISPENLPKLTEPFFRVDKARSREHGGVGLGLTLVKQIADVHGANLAVESALGVGTKISIVFPSML